MPSVARWVAFWGVSVPLIAVGLAAALFSRRASHQMGRLWGQVALRIFSVRVAVEHQGPGYDRPPYVFCQMNQTSLCESFVVPAVIPIPYVILVNLEFALIPFLGWIAVLGGVLVVRQWPAQRKRAGERATKALRRGKSFYISIEGARSPGPALLPYKKGPVVMALGAKASLVPIYFYGAREVWPHGEWRVRPGTVRVVFGVPVDLGARSLDERDSIVSELRAEAELALEGHLPQRDGPALP